MQASRIYRAWLLIGFILALAPAAQAGLARLKCTVRFAVRSSRSTGRSRLLGQNDAIDPKRNGRSSRNGLRSRSSLAPRGIRIFSQRDC